MESKFNNAMRKTFELLEDRHLDNKEMDSFVWILCNRLNFNYIKNIN